LEGVGGVYLHPLPDGVHTEAVELQVILLYPVGGDLLAAVFRRPFFLFFFSFAIV